MSIQSAKEKEIILNSLIIRNATSADTKASSEIVTKSLNSFGIEPDPIEFDKELLTIGQPKSANCTDLVAVSANRIVGVAVTRIESNETFLCGLYVDQFYRGCGIGKALLNRIIDNARASHAIRVRLETREIFKEAVMLYESTGWVRGPNTANTSGPERTYYLDL